MTRISSLAEQQLRDVVRKVDVMWSRQPRMGMPMLAACELYVAVVDTGGISAASWPTAGTGGATLYEYNPDSGDFQSITREGTTTLDAQVTVVNWVEESLAADDHVIVAKTNNSKGQGIYVVISKDC